MVSDPPPTASSASQCERSSEVEPSRQPNFDDLNGSQLSTTMAVSIWNGIPGEYEHCGTDYEIREDCFDIERVSIPAVEIATADYRLAGSEGTALSDCGFAISLITPLGVAQKNTICGDLYDQVVDFYGINECRENESPHMLVWERHVQGLPQTGRSYNEFGGDEESTASDFTLVQALPTNVLTVEGGRWGKTPRLQPQVTACTRLLVSLSRTHGWFEPTVEEEEYGER